MVNDLVGTSADSIWIRELELQFKGKDCVDQNSDFIHLALSCSLMCFDLKGCLAQRLQLHLLMICWHTVSSGT